jgi:hypothetical protein
MAERGVSGAIRSSQKLILDLLVFALAFVVQLGFAILFFVAVAALIAQIL